MSKFKIACKALILVCAFHIPAIAADKAIADYVDGLMNAFFAITQDVKLNEQDKINKARSLLETNLDFEWMSKFVLGRYRRDMPDQDLKDFVQVYKVYLINTYADAVRQYKGETIVIKNVHQLSEDEFVVKTAISKLDQDPMFVDYLIRHSANGAYDKPYKVFDVVTEGVSLISSQQAEFGSIIGSKGIRALIGDLKRKAN